MASDKQIAANRRNACKSTGPRSGAGKKRAGRNAYRHGLSLCISLNATFAKKVEQLARKIAGDTNDEIILDRARAAAAAELDLVRVRRAKVALIERVRAFGSLDSPPQEITEASKAMPTQEPERSAEALRRVLPELVKLDRYERRAASRRDRAAMDVIVAQNSKYNL